MNPQTIATTAFRVVFSVEQKRGVNLQRIGISLESKPQSPQGFYASTPSLSPQS